MMETNVEHQIGRATKWSSITELSAKLVSPIVNMILARLLAPEAFGVVATITMVISFAEIFTDAGFQKYIIQHEFQSTEDLDKSTNVAFWTNLSISFFICIFIFFFRDPIADMVGSPGLGSSISIASVLILIAAFASIQAARYKRAFDFKTLFYARIGMVIIPLIVTVPLAFILRNYWALLIGNFVSQLFNAVFLTIKSKWKPSFFYSFPLLKKMFSFSAWTLLETISIWLTNYIGIFVVGSHLNEYYLGLYKTSMATVNSYMAIITSAFTPVLFSALSRYQNNDVMYKKTYFDIQSVIATVVFPMGIGIFLFRDMVTSILLGEQWMEASGFVGLWGLTSAIVIVLSNLSGEVYRSKGNPKISLFSQVLHLLFVILALSWGIKQSFETLYTVRALIRLQSIIDALILMKVLYKFDVSATLKNVFPMLLSAVIMGIVGYCLKSINGNMIWHFLSALICVPVYFTVLIGCFPRVRRKLMEIEYVGKLINKIKQKF